MDRRSGQEVPLGVIHSFSSDHECEKGVFMRISELNDQ